jgi:hypothetical protein
LILTSRYRLPWGPAGVFQESSPEVADWKIKQGSDLLDGICILFRIFRRAAKCAVASGEIHCSLGAFVNGRRRDEDDARVVGRHLWALNYLDEVQFEGWERDALIPVFLRKAGVVRSEEQCLYSAVVRLCDLD